MENEGVKKNYKSLMDKVSNNGKYQWAVFFMVFSFWIFHGFSDPNIEFLFLKPGLHVLKGYQKYNAKNMCAQLSKMKMFANNTKVKNN